MAVGKSDIVERVMALSDEFFRDRIDETVPAVYPKNPKAQVSHGAVKPCVHVDVPKRNHRRGNTNIRLQCGRISNRPARLERTANAKFLKSDPPSLLRRALR